MCGIMLETAEGSSIERGEALAWGISPFNSFYSAATIRRLMRWSLPRFDRVYVLLAGPEAASRFICSGVTPHRAVDKVMTQVHYQRRAAQRAIRDAGYPHAARDVIVWTRLYAAPRYQELRALMRDAYDTHTNVRELARSTIAQVLASPTGDPPPRAHIDANVDYVLAEMPFVLDAAALLGHRRAVFAYHRRFPLFDYLATGAVPALRPGAGQTYAQLTLLPESHDERPHTSDGGLPPSVR
ncbi:tRNA-dependent cyclodipeptide synthase [Streptomyces sp. NPDC047014]|uniref:tRNA-dependent cyclodipeptide synthase n=1 Tax=Streptomyces sp. NPDC047014 TaxID=3155736 RepID=UPI0033E3B63B